MEITTRNVWSGKYMEVNVRDGSTTIELGLLNKDEVKTLRDHLKSTVDDLTYFIGDVE